MGKEFETERIYICINTHTHIYMYVCITKSLSYIPETNITLLITYMPI